MKWTDSDPTAADVERTLQRLVAKGLPPLSGAPPSDIRYAVFMRKRPKSKRGLPSNAVLVDARDVLAALR